MDAATRKRLNLGKEGSYGIEDMTRPMKVIHRNIAKEREEEAKRLKILAELEEIRKAKERFFGNQTGIIIP